MDTIQIIHAASVAGAAAFLASGYFLGRARAKGAGSSIGDVPAPSAGSNGANVDELMAVVEKQGAQLASLRSKTQTQAEKLRALQEHARTAPQSSVGRLPAPPASPSDDDSVATELPQDSRQLQAALKKETARRRDAEAELGKLQNAVSRLDGALDAKRRELAEANERVLAMRELMTTNSASAPPAAAQAPRARADDDQVSRMQAALGKMEGQLQQTRARYQEAKEKLNAMAELVSQKGSATTPVPKGSRSTADDTRSGADVRTLQLALTQQEQKLAQSKADLAAAKETINALKELVARQGGAKKTLPGGLVRAPTESTKDGASQDEVSRLQQAVSLLETKLRRAESAEADAKEKVRALSELAARAGAAPRVTTSPKKDVEREAAARRQAEQQVTRLQTALSQLEQSLSSKQAELSTARETIAALEELGRRQADR